MSEQNNVNVHVIDFDADPFVPKGWGVSEHTKGGKLEFDPSKVTLYLDEEQQNVGTIVGAKLREKLKGKAVFNANLLEFYLKNPHLIPDEWKDKNVFFWGTIYSNAWCILCVRCLSWDWGCCCWGWNYLWLGSSFHDYFPATISASN